MKIKVLGTGCAKCKSLTKSVSQIIEEQDLNASLEVIEDIQEIMAYGIMSTPGLVIDEKLVLSGKLPKYEELKELLKLN